MHNMMSYDRRWLDEPHNGDHVGRAVWALGVVIAAHPPRAVAAPSLRLLEELAPAVGRDGQPAGHGRSRSIGLTRPPLEALPDDAPRAAARPRRTGCWRPIRCHRTDDWRWFEDDLTYDNARLPQALIAAGHRLGDEPMLAAGLEALDWYGAQCALDSAERPAGRQLAGSAPRTPLADR